MDEPAQTAKVEQKTPPATPHTAAVPTKAPEGTQPEAAKPAVLYVAIPTGPKADLYQGHAVSVDPMEFLNNEGDWSVDDGGAFEAAICPSVPAAE